MAFFLVAGLSARVFMYKVDGFYTRLRQAMEWIMIAPHPDPARDTLGASMRPPVLCLLSMSLALAACAPSRPAVATSEPSPAPATGIPTEGHLPQVDWLAYRDPTGGFSIQHPLTWQESQGSGYPVVFTLQAAPGTTLLNKTMEIMVTPDSAECKESTYSSDTGTTSPHQVVINGVNFLKETGSGIGAGNIYDWTAYSTRRGTTCITITFVLHSANAGVYSTEPAPFDKVAESVVFDELIDTFRFGP